MKYFGYIIVSVCLLLSACNDAEVEGEKESTGIAGFEETGISAFENQPGVTVKINLSRPATERVRLHIGICEEKNIRENEHFFIADKEPVIEAGKQSVEVGFTLTDDNVANDARSFCLRLIEASGAQIDTARAKICVSVLDDESESGIGFAAPLFSCREQLKEIPEASYVTAVPLQIFGTLKEEVQLKLAVLSTGNKDEAIENKHFRIPSKTIRLTPGAALEVPLEIIDDDEINENRQFVLEITSVVGASGVTSLKRCVVTILNDDLGLSFKRTRFTVEERGNTVLRIPVKVLGTVEEAIHGTVTLGGTAQEGTHYTIAHDWVINPGEDSLLLELTPVYEQGFSPDRTVELGIQPAAGIQFTGDLCEVKILDCDASLDFVYPEFPALNEALQVRVPVVLEQALEHDVTCQVKIQGVQGMLEEQVRLIKSSVTIPAGKTTDTVVVALPTLTSDERAWVRLEVTETYGASVGAVCRVNKCFKYTPAEGWFIAGFSSEEVGMGNIATLAIDGNTDTFWHSNWSTDGGTSLPQGIVVGLPDGMQVMAVDVVRRVHRESTQSDNKTADLYLSTDVNTYAGEWGAIAGKFTWQYSPEEAVTDVQKHTARAVVDGQRPAKYVKVVVTGTWTNRSFGQIAEVMVWGYRE